LPRGAELLIYPPKITVNIRGGIEILGKITKRNIKAYVLYREAVLDTTGAIKPHVLLPENIELLNVLPDKIEYVIKK